MVCPSVSAYELTGRLPRPELYWTANDHLPDREGWNMLRTALLQLTQEVASGNAVRRRRRGWRVIRQG
ncbi:MAG: hypothetical protein M3P97_00850 [Actinomycetota bacterium]|jgi:hypothetical protein|nr:hypothetical protein [Actinomycetota bacterium]